MPIDQFPFRRTAIAFALAAAFPGVALAAGAARVQFATPGVTATGADGRARSLGPGSEIVVGDTVNTQEGRAQLAFADGALMSLQPQTEFRLEQFRFNQRDQGPDGLVMNLLKGGLRTITGLVGRDRRRDYQLRTSVATIGIRGTEFSVMYGNSINVHTADGEVVVQNETGTTSFTGGQGVSVQSQSSRPQATEERPPLPPQQGSEQQQQQQQQRSAPANPIQEQTPPVPETRLLTGSFSEANVAYVTTGNFPQLGINQPQVLDSAGRLTSFTTDYEGATQLGTATAISQGNDGVIAWGRWVNGTTTGYNSATLSGNTQLHYAVGLPATNIPTSGTATYSMIGHTTPTCSTGCSVSLNSSSLTVDFGSPNATLSMSMTIDGTAWSASASGTPSGANLYLSGSMGAGCSSGCFVARGFLAGDGASRAGLAYKGDISGTYINGAAAYRR